MWWFIIGITLFVGIGLSLDKDYYNRDLNDNIHDGD